MGWLERFDAHQQQVHNYQSSGGPALKVEGPTRRSRVLGAVLAVVLIGAAVVLGVTRRADVEIPALLLGGLVAVIVPLAALALYLHFRWSRAALDKVEPRVPPRD
jgi:hypothetical protein